MNSNSRNRNPRDRVDWSKEVAGSGKLAGRVVGRFFSYLLNILLTVMLICVITGIIVGTVFAVYIKNYIDPEVDLSLFSVANTNQTTRVYYMDYSDRENRIGEMVELEDQRLFGSENSVWVSYTNIPENLVNAFVSIEDKRFWSHHGVDWFRTATAIVNYIIPFGGSYGGSTITQQTIKNITEDNDFTPQRKIQEILRALNLEKQLDKTQILELYLNNIPLSQNCYGVQAAAYTYFNKDVSDLSLIECAAIAAITNRPTKYDPVLNPEEQANRRDGILEEMRDQGYITQAEFDSAYEKDLILDYQGRAREVTATTNSWYTDQVMVEIVNKLVAEKGYTSKMAYQQIYGGGLSIVTLQDPEVQSVLEEIYENDENFPKTNNAVQPQSSAVIIDPQTGDVLGLVGARGKKEGDLLLNHATQTTRSPGSSLKPLSVYAPALEYGLITYGSVFDDVPVQFNTTEGSSALIAYPKNLPAVYNGLTTVNDAVTRSVNTVAMRVLQKLTVDRSYDFVKNKLQMGSFLEYKELADGRGVTDITEASLALGAMTYGVTTLEITAAYQIFDNGGVYNKPRTWLKVLDNNGNVLLDNESESYVVISKQNASIMTRMLQNVVERGTATAVTLKSKINVAGKTGTTSSDVDRWFVGYTPYYVGGVWFGYDTPQELGSLAWSPSVVAWDYIMLKLHQKFITDASSGGEPLKTFELADGVIQATYCKDSGKLMSTACHADPRGNRAEVGYFTAATIPTEYCDTHVLVSYDKTTGGVASENCPAENVVNVGLLNISKYNRVFPINIKVTDAQYTYLYVPDGTPMPTSGDVPFYMGLYAAGTYPGYSDTNGKRVFNSYCYEHHNAVKEPEETTPVETSPPDSGSGTNTKPADTEAPPETTAPPETGAANSPEIE